MAHLLGADRARYVRSMFDRVAPGYERMNDIMTWGQHHGWIQKLVDTAAPTHVQRVLDVATGTGAVARGFAAFAPEVVALDFSEGMLRAGSFPSAVRVVAGDALALPFPDDSFDGAAIAFGLRNIPDHVAVLREMVRVVRPGGRVASLELTRTFYPGFGRIMTAYFRWVVPLLAEALGAHSPAYAYLWESMQRFPDAFALRDDFKRAGLVFPAYALMNFGSIAVHYGSKPVV